MPFPTNTENENNVLVSIYEKHVARMLYNATQILGRERGEEAVQDVFIQLIEKYRENFDQLLDKPNRFFIIVVRNYSLNLLKRERLEQIPLEDEQIFSGEEDSPEERSVSADSREELLRLIRRLNPTMREILEYKYVLEYSNKEIAKLMGISPSAVSSRIDRAKKALKRKLEESEWEAK